MYGSPYLQIADILMEKLSATSSKLFVKEVFPFKKGVEQCFQDGMLIAKDEIFRPFQLSPKFKDINAVIRRFRLAADVFTQDLDTATTVICALKAGAIWINCFDKADATISFNGHKLGGFGVYKHRESFVAVSASIIDNNDPQSHQNLFGVGLDTQMTTEAMESLLYNSSLTMDAKKDNILKKNASKEDEHPQNQKISLRSKWKIQKISIFGVKNPVMGNRFRKPAWVMSSSRDGRYLAQESKDGVVSAATVSLVHARLYEDQLSLLGNHWETKAPKDWFWLFSELHKGNRENCKFG